MGEFSRGERLVMEAGISSGDRRKDFRGNTTVLPHPFHIQRPDGQIRWIVAKARAFQDENGKPLPVIGVNMDVTDRKLAEEALRESEKRFRVAQELSLDAFTILHAIRNSTGEIIDF